MPPNLRRGVGPGISIRSKLPNELAATPGVGRTGRSGRRWCPPKVTQGGFLGPRALGGCPQCQANRKDLSGSALSLSLHPSGLKAQPQLFRAVAILRPTNKTGERKALSQNGISVPIPLLPTPVPLVPRPGAVSASQRWGRRVGQEGGGEDLGASCPPSTCPSLPGLRAGCPGAVVSEADRSALSFLPAGGRGGADWGAGSGPPSPPPPALGPQGLGVPVNPACPSSGSQFQKKKEHWESRQKAAGVDRIQTPASITGGLGQVCSRTPASCLALITSPGLPLPLPSPSLPRRLHSFLPSFIHSLATSSVPGAQPITKDS